MYSFGNRWESIVNSLNLKKKFDNWLLNHIRENYNSDLDYVNTIYKKWRKAVYEVITDVLVNGLLTWTFLLAIMNVVPSIGNIFRVGPTYFHILTILSSGFAVWYVKGTYKWFRKDYKGGTK